MYCFTIQSMVRDKSMASVIILTLCIKISDQDYVLLYTCPFLLLYIYRTFDILGRAYYIFSFYLLKFDLVNYQHH